MNNSDGNNAFTCNVLIINGQKQTSDFISTILIEPDYKVQLGSTTELFLKLIQQQTPDIILIQIRMDYNKDIDICKKIKENEKTKQIPIILIIPQNENIDKVKYYELGIADIITLPINPIELLNRVKIQFFTLKLMRENNFLKKIIDKNKELELPIKENEEKLRSIMESINDLVFVLDKNGVFCNFYQSKNRPDLYLPPEKFLGKSFRKVMPLHVVNLIDTAIDALEKTGEVQQIDYYLELPDGIQWFNAKISKFMNSSKEFIGFTYVIRDITERKNLEEIMEKDRQELKLIIDSLPILVFYKDKEGRIIRVNKAFAEALNMPEEDLTGKTAYDLYSNKIAQSMTEDDKEVLDTYRSKLNIIEQYESVNGLRWVRTDKIPIFDKNNFLIGLICFAQDITERKQAVEALQCSEEKYRELVENLNDALYSATSDGIINYISPVVQSISDYTPEDLIGKNFLIIIHPDDYKLVQNAMLSILQGNIFSGEFRVLLKNGEIKWARTSSRPVYEDRKIIGMQGVITDITERKKIEDEIKKYINEITALNTISHVASQSIDLKEILNSILTTTLAILSIEGGIIYLYDEYKQLFIPAAYYGMSDDTIHEVTGFRLGQGLSGKAAESNEPIILPDLFIDSRNLSPTAVREGWHSYAGIPIKSKNKILGVMTLVSHTINYFKNEHLNMLNLIGNQIGSTIENAHLFQQLERELKERKLAENALKISEAKLSNSMKISNLGHWEYDVANDLFTFNDNFYAIFRTTADKAGGYTMSSAEYAKRFIHPDDIEIVGLESKKAIEKYDPNLCWYMEHRIIYADGRIGYIAVRFFVVKDNNGNTIKTHGVNQDITEYKNIEEALSISEAKLSNAMKIANLGHWEYDIANDLFTFNDNFYAIFRTTAEKVGGYTMSSAEYAKRFLYPDDIPLVSIETNKAIETSDPYFSRFLEHRIIYADGEPGYITVRIFIVKDNKGNTIKTYGVNQDITERKKIEEELKKSLKEKELLLKEINHRVKNNLNVILSLLKYQEDNIKDNDSKEKFQKIENRIYSIALIHGMLYKSKNIYKINFKEYINDLVNYLSVAFGEKPDIIKVLFNIEEFELDIDQIKTLGLILNELLTNSLKYAQPGKKKKKIIISLNYDNDNYIIKIKDNGRGMPENFDINKITTSGLFLVKILCEEISGKLNFTNNNGVEVNIKFPIKNKGDTILKK